MSKHKTRLGLGFGILGLGHYLGFGAWCLEI
jgi:hypothetical protein